MIESKVSPVETDEKAVKTVVLDSVTDGSLRKERLLNFFDRLSYLSPPLILVLAFFLTWLFAYDSIKHITWIPSIHHVICLIPLPTALMTFLGLGLSHRTPETKLEKIRSFKQLYVVIVTKGTNKDTIYRGWELMKELIDPERGISVIVLTDEPHFYPDVNCVTVPKTFETAKAKHKARALEYFRQKMEFDKDDWILHLDEESVIDKANLEAVIDFIERTNYDYGQGSILYNQYGYWDHPLIAAADGIRVGDDIGRFHLQYKVIHKPICCVRGSFLLTNGAMENDLTWDCGSLAEDLEFMLHALDKKYVGGKIAGFIHEQSPQTIVDYLKQRRRWFVGIKSIRHPVAYFLLFQWVSVLVFLIIGLLTFLIPGLKDVPAPLWTILLINFMIVTTSYTHIVGIISQDLDLNIRWYNLLFHSIFALIAEPAISLLECAVIVWGIFTNPRSFEVIKK